MSNDKTYTGADAEKAIKESLCGTSLFYIVHGAINYHRSIQRSPAILAALDAEYATTEEQNTALRAVGLDDLVSECAMTEIHAAVGHEIICLNKHLTIDGAAVELILEKVIRHIVIMSTGDDMPLVMRDGFNPTDLDSDQHLDGSEMRTWQIDSSELLNRALDLSRSNAPAQSPILDILRMAASMESTPEGGFLRMIADDPDKMFNELDKMFGGGNNGQ